MVMIYVRQQLREKLTRIAAGQISLKLEGIGASVRLDDSKAPIVGDTAALCLESAKNRGASEIHFYVLVDNDGFKMYIWDNGARIASDTLENPGLDFRALNYLIVDEGGELSAASADNCITLFLPAGSE